MITYVPPEQVIVWDVDYGANGEWITTPRHVLVAHTAPVKCVAKATAGQDCHIVVSSSENGEMFVWDTVDGRVIESKRYPQFVHTSIQAYRTPDSQGGNSIDILAFGRFSGAFWGNFLSLQYKQSSSSFTFPFR